MTTEMSEFRETSSNHAPLYTNLMIAKLKDTHREASSKECIDGLLSFKGSAAEAVVHKSARPEGA